MDIIDTTFLLEYDLIDTTASEDGAVVCNQNESFADATKLNEGTDYSGFMTMEHNFSCLDGTLNEMPVSPNVAIFTSVYSDENGDFDIIPAIEITFTENHSSIGFTLEFSENYPLACRISWYTLGGDLITRQRLEITSLKAALFAPKENYGKVVIEFTKALPYRNIKINKIYYGIEYVWGEDTIVDASMVEEVSIISDNISINTLDFSIYDSTDDFNLGNSGGLHPYIQTGQVVDAYELVRGEKLYLGRKFINTFSSENGLIKFKCQSYLGLLDKIIYYKGDLYTNGIKAGLLIDDIMNLCGIDNYEVEPDVYNTIVYGTLSPESCRNCLKEILFATQATIDTSRIDGIRIYRRTQQITGKIGRDIKISTKVTKREYVSGVAVSYKSYIKDEVDPEAEPNEILNGIYPAGDNLITWDSPYDNIIASTGTIKEVGKYYCILTLTEEAEVTLTGETYTENESSITVNIANIEGGRTKNIKSYSGKLLDSILAKNVATKILQYQSYQLALNIQYLASNENIKNFTLIQNPDNKYADFVAQFESITTNLTAGFVSTAKMVGFYNIETGFYYADSELVADDDVIM